MKKVIKFAKDFSPSIIALALPILAFADSPAPPTVPANIPQSGITTVGGVLNLLCVVFAWMFYFLIVLAVIFVIWAAFKYLTAAGDPEKVKGAGQTLLYAAIAIGVALLARAVPVVIAQFINTTGTVSSC